MKYSFFQDGSMGQMVICKDESGHRIDCPCEEEKNENQENEPYSNKILCCLVSYLQNIC